MKFSCRFRCFFVTSLFAAICPTFHVHADSIAARVDLSTISPCPSFCGGSGSVSDFASDGGPGSTFASQSISNNDGNGQGFARLDGPTMLPVLGAEAFSESNSRVSTTSTGQQPYLYTGAASTNITLDFTLEGEAAAPAQLDARVAASVVAVRGSSLPFFTDYGTLVFEVIPLTPGLSELGKTEVSIPVNAGPQTITGSVPITLNPGDRFFVWSSLNARGTRSGSGSALNTFGVEFSDPTGIVPVPEPATFGLLLGGLSAWGLRRRR